MYFSEGVYAEDGEVGVGLGVAHDVKVDQFLELHGVSGDVLEDVHEEGGYVLPVGHVGDDAPDGLLLLVEVVAVQFLFQLPDLPGLPLVTVTHV